MSQVTPTEVPVPTSDGGMPAQFWFPEDGGDGERPAVVVFQEIFGLSDYVLDRCADLSRLGYAVLAPRFYWRQGVDRVDESSPDYLKEGMRLAGMVDWEETVRDGMAAAEHLRMLPQVGKVGLVGFCFGGGLAYDVASRLSPPPAALVSYYGSALPQLIVAGTSVSVPSLHHFGTADDYIPMDRIALIRDWVTGVPGSDDATGATTPDATGVTTAPDAAGLTTAPDARGVTTPDEAAPVRFELHEGAGHAFDNPHELFHHPQASADAWRQTQEFLAEHLPID